MPPPDFVEQAREKGWPDGLMARAQAVMTPRWILEMWLSDTTPHELLVANVERQVGIFEKLESGTLRARELTNRDEESFSELWSKAPERIGDWEIIVERGPNAVAQFRLHEDASIAVVEDRGQIIACTAWCSENLLLAGAPSSIHFAMAMRVAAERRREGLGDVVRRYPKRSMARTSIGQVMYMRTGNEGVETFLKTVGFRAGDTRPQLLVSVTHFAAAASELPISVRFARPEDAAACAELINRTHAGLDLFRPLGEESLSLRLNGGIWGAAPPWAPHVYGWQDYYVLEAGGRIVACAGLWDRGRDVREHWRNTVTGETRTVASMSVLDFGCAEGREAELAGLIRGLVGRTAQMGRTGLAVHLERLPNVAELLADLTQETETRVLEWSPFLPSAPAELGPPFVDLRFW
ncbi:MAG TPA: hypothetical protein VIO94_17565 [Phenylobacterium sp.]